MVFGVRVRVGIIMIYFDSDILTIVHVVHVPFYQVPSVVH